MAQVQPNPDPGFEENPKLDWETNIKNQQAAFDALREKVQNLPDGEVVGAILSLPYADGVAYYLVKSAKPLKLRHLPYMDAWHTDPATLRGLRLTDVEQRVG